MQKGISTLELGVTEKFLIVSEVIFLLRIIRVRFFGSDSILKNSEISLTMPIIPLVSMKLSILNKLKINSMELNIKLTREPLKVLPMAIETPTKITANEMVCMSIRPIIDIKIKDLSPKLIAVAKKGLDVESTRLLSRNFFLHRFR